MTPAQIDMYAGEDARIEAESGGIGVDPKTGHRTVKASSPAEAAALLKKLKAGK